MFDVMFIQFDLMLCALMVPTLLLSFLGMHPTFSLYAVLPSTILLVLFSFKSLRLKRVLCNILTRFTSDTVASATDMSVCSHISFLRARRGFPTDITTNRRPVRSGPSIGWIFRPCD